MPPRNEGALIDHDDMDAKPSPKPAPSKLSQHEKDVQAKQRAARPASVSPTTQVQQIDRDITAKQQARRTTPAVAPGAYYSTGPPPAAVLAVAPGAYHATSPPPADLLQMDRNVTKQPTTTSVAVVPGAYATPPEELDRLDARIAAKQTNMAPSSTAVAGVPGAMKAQVMAATGVPAKKMPPVAAIDAGLQAKERERQLRKDALSQRSLMAIAAAKPAPASTAVLDDGMQAKERERTLRKEALSQRSLMAAVAAKPAASPPPNQGQDEGAQAKERERQLRKDALSQRSLMSALSQRSLMSAASQRSLKSAASAKAKASPQCEGMQAKQRERKLRKEHLSQRSLISGASCSSRSLMRDESSQATTVSMNGTGVDCDIAGLPVVTAPTGKLGASAAPTGTDVQATHTAGAYPVIRSDHPKSLQPTSTQAPKREVGPDLEMGRVLPHEAAPSAILTPHPQPMLEEETTTAPTSPAAVEEPGNGLNLVEATLVVEEMVEATVATPMEFQQDEIMRIREQSAKETARIKLWRTVVSVALLVTAVAVTTSTYYLLVDREQKNFHNVYDQFATTVADAAIEFQKNLRYSLRSFADTVATMAEVSGNGTSPWPYFIVDRWETLGHGFKKVSNAEFVAIQNYVTHNQRDSYVDFITPRYQDFVKEAHMEAYGSLDFLDTDTANYQPFIAQKLSNGTFVPDIERDFYFARTTQSPPARMYGPTINNNLIADKVIGDGFAAVMEMHDELVFTSIKPFANVPKEEHAKMHSNGAEGASNPHSFTFHPVHRVPGNQSSDIVAMFAVATAWDFSMLNLLPDNVKGMYCVVQNSCNQTVTYRIDGSNATYLGDGELQPAHYDDMAVFVDLNLQENPKARRTPGHCMYSMKIYPSRDFEDDYTTNTPVIYASVVAVTFVLIAITLLLYDRTVTKRNEKMIYQAAKTNAILSKFVPDHLRDRIMGFNRKPDGLSESSRIMGDMSRRELHAGLMDMSKVSHR